MNNNLQEYYERLRRIEEQKSAGKIKLWNLMNHEERISVMRFLYIKENLLEEDIAHLLETDPTELQKFRRRQGTMFFQKPNSK